MSGQHRGVRKDLCHSIVSSRLLVLQSKRLVLSSTERRMRRDAHGQNLPARVQQLRREIETAHEAYQQTMLEWGSPEQQDFWVVAYSRLIDKGQVLTVKLRTAHPALPPADRYEVSADVEMLEGMIARWTDSKRRSMVAASMTA